MSKNLVIVESPAKAKTLGRFLGSKYRVEASFGHIRDLPESAASVPKEIKEKDWGRMGVAVDSDFTPDLVLRLKTFLDTFPQKVSEYDSLIASNRIWLGRTKNVAVSGPIGLGDGPGISWTRTDAPAQPTTRSWARRTRSMRVVVPIWSTAMRARPSCRRSMTW